ncbi:hypothetical protein NQ318_016255 [Aromia moschata]|uniref:Peptidase S1 domain-containing protein n=1 Tax=Aromia moschata TaxID=1265417 RepID=A0AAV8XYN1_9CUCU|nr:hypothetical protein NQ318_016255 [Aromia moschata]
MLKVTVAVLAILGVTLGLPQPSKSPGGRIIGGHDTTIQEHPYQLALYFHRMFICGAVLLRYDWAITTAHCTEGWQVNGLIVRAGSTTVSVGGQLANVLRVVYHERYNRRTLDYNYALLEFRGSIAVRNAAPATLPAPTRGIYPGEMATISGWGRTSVTNYYPDVLQATEVPILNLLECELSYPGYDITETMFCGGVLGYTGKDASHGDRGGPVIIDGELVGLISFAISHGAPETPDVYANIPIVRNWIQSITGI